jgi:hypothetical protein
MIRWFVLLLMICVATPVWAQPAGPTPEDRRAKIKKRIRALRAYTLTEELSLDEKTAGKLFPLLAKFDDELDKLLSARVDLEKRLLDAGSSTDGKAIDKVIDEAAANQKALWDIETRRLAELRKILTPQQVARTLVVLPKMERQIQNQLRKAAMAKQKAQPVDPYGDDDFVDPFATKKGKAKAKAKQDPGGDLGGNPYAKKKYPCDPFGDMRGCAK